MIDVIVGQVAIAVNRGDFIDRGDGLGGAIARDFMQGEERVVGGEIGARKEIDIAFFWQVEVDGVARQGIALINRLIDVGQVGRGEIGGTDAGVHEVKAVDVASRRKEIVKGCPGVGVFAR